MKKMIKYLNLGILSALLLAGCSANENLTTTETNKSITHKGTVSIGDDLINSNYFVGFDGDEVLIQYSESRILHIPKETTEWLNIPYSSGTIKYKISNPNKVNGTIDIEIVQEKQG